MSSVVDILRRNRATYYRYDTGALVRVWPRYTLIVIIAFAAAVTMAPLTDFMPAIISALAILAGFSFSVLFFLVTNRIDVVRTAASIEQNLRQDKLEKLAAEIFDNISYFNLLALLGVTAALLNLLTLSTGFLGQSAPVANYRDWLSVAQQMGEGVVIALAIESLLTFYRTTQRVVYFFGQIRKYGR